MMTNAIYKRLAGAVVVLAVALIMGCGGGPQGFVPTDVEGGGPEKTAEGVTFTFIDAKINRINIVGDFNNWSTTADPLLDRVGDGTWTIRIPLKPGRYEYKYLIDGKKWSPDPWNPNVVDDGFGSLNSVLVVE
jgi:hypothetical protein